MNKVEGRMVLAGKGLVDVCDAEADSIAKFWGEEFVVDVKTEQFEVIGVASTTQLASNILEPNSTYQFRV